ncbi:MAG TPA: gamma-glutamyl-gamma-aminobutyrate hydrolase family protein [Kofleriaceae bacterium]|nr:gamma-glutamyl-gamma-aminobutyrate hydrolase family protein [Kofleriaceae bacterium]
MRPVIAVTGPDRGGFPAWLFTSWALRRAGAKPVRVHPRRGEVAGFDGLVIGGGADVAPVRYGALPARRPAAASYRRSRTLPRLAVDYALAPFIYVLRRAFGLSRAASAGPDPARDALELALIARAEEAGVPVLGICRGAQLLNIHAGGTLHQDLSGFYTERSNRWTVFPRKAIRVEPSSRLRATLGHTRCEVNSLHRQAVDAIGDGLAVVARDERGVVQGIEHSSRRFWIGVQWHPEYLPQVPEQRRLFAALVAAARQR